MNIISKYLGLIKEVAGAFNSGHTFLDSINIAKANQSAPKQIEEYEDNSEIEQVDNDDDLVPIEVDIANIGRKIRHKKLIDTEKVKKKKGKKKKGKKKSKDKNKDIEQSNSSLSEDKIAAMKILGMDGFDWANLKVIQKYGSIDKLILQKVLPLSEPNFRSFVTGTHALFRSERERYIIKSIDKAKRLSALHTILDDYSTAPEDSSEQVKMLSHKLACHAYGMYRRELLKELKKDSPPPIPVTAAPPKKEKKRVPKILLNKPK